jgi:hypothetical protein
MTVHRGFGGNWQFQPLVRKPKQNLGWDELGQWMPHSSPELTLLPAGDQVVIEDEVRPQLLTGAVLPLLLIGGALYWISR